MDSAETNQQRSISMKEAAILKNWDSIKYFEPHEFDSPDKPGSGLSMNIEFVKMLDQLRELCGFPLKITSGYRTPEWNAQLEHGKPNSAHLQGIAADIACMSSHQRYVLLKHIYAMDFKRVGLGKTFIHVDISYDLPQEMAWNY